MPEPDCFLRLRLSAATRNFTSGKSDLYVLAAAATRGFNMVLFIEPVSRGTCASPSALLVNTYVLVTTVTFANLFLAFTFVAAFNKLYCIVEPVTAARLPCRQ